MAESPIDSVQIIEPPITELTKPRSSFKRSCLSGCGCVVVFVLALGIGYKLIIGPGPKTVSAVPANFPTAIPLYDKDTIQSITVVPGKYKDRSLELAALFPRIFVSPVLLRTQNLDAVGTEASSTPESIFSSLWHIITTPSETTQDIVQIEWKNMAAEPSFVYGHYKKELSKKGYTIFDETKKNDKQQFSFRHADGTHGTFSVDSDNNKQKPRTEAALLIVNINRLSPTTSTTSTTP